MRQSTVVRPGARKHSGIFVSRATVFRGHRSGSCPADGGGDPL